MMGIQIRKVVRPLGLRDLAEEYGDDFLSVWVNPDRGALALYERAREETEKIKKQLAGLPDREKADPEKVQAISNSLDEANRIIYAWYAEIWSQGQDPAQHVTAAAVEEWAQKADPAIWFYVTSGTWRLINEHLFHAKKG
jgi:hypothetical protein